VPAQKRWTNSKATNALLSQVFLSFISLFHHNPTHKPP